MHALESYLLVYVKRNIVVFFSLAFSLSVAEAGTRGTKQLADLPHSGQHAGVTEGCLLHSSIWREPVQALGLRGYLDTWLRGTTHFLSSDEHRPESSPIVWSPAQLRARLQGYSCRGRMSSVGWRKCPLRKIQYHKSAKGNSSSEKVARGPLPLGA